MLPLEIARKLSADNPDIRQQVDANRGLTKNIELLIPGLRGYRQSEDIRVADSLLRNQVADKLDQGRANLENLRKQMAGAGDFSNLTQVGSLIFQVQQFSGEVRHAQQGYAGFAATIKVNQDKLNKLYEYDYDFVAAAVQFIDATSRTVYDPTSPASIISQVSAMSSALTDTKRKWAVRMEAIENILVS